MQITKTQINTAQEVYTKILNGNLITDSEIEDALLVFRIVEQFLECHLIFFLTRVEISHHIRELEKIQNYRKQI